MKIFVFLLLSSALFATEIDIAETYFVKGGEFYDAKDYQKAIEQYTKAVKLEPTVGMYRLALGSAYGKNNQYDEAIPHLKKAVALDSNLIDGYYLIEEFYSKIGREDSAIAYFMKEKNLHPNRVVGYINLGHLYYRLKDYDNAFQEFGKAQVLQPNNPVAYCGVGVVALSQGNDEAAEVFFTDAIKLDTLYAEAHLYYSIVLLRKGMTEEADKEKELAYKLKPALKDVDLSGVLPLRGEKADIPFIVSTIDIIIEKLIRPEERKVIMAMRKPFDLNLGLGFAKIGTEPWLSLISGPEMDYDWLGFKLSLGLFFNADGEIRTEEFDYIKIFQNVRVGHPNLPFHLGFGLVKDYTLGYGLIVRNYFNQADENNRRLGGVFTLQTPDNVVGATGMLNNFTEKEVMAERIFLGRWAPTPENLLQRFEAGFTYAQDGEYGLKAMGGDMLCYLASGGKFHFLVVSELASIQTHGLGNMSGLLLHIGGLSSREFSISLFGAGLFLGKDFVPAPFDAFYEKNRWQYGSYVADSLLKNYQESATGLYTMGSLRLGPVARVAVDYQSVTGVPESGIFSARAIVAEDMPFIRLQGFFYKYHFDDFNTLTTMDENTYIAGLAGIKLIGDLLSLNFLYERTYVWQEPNGPYEIQEKVSPYVQFGKKF